MTVDEQEFANRWVGAGELYGRAVEWLPGGNTRTQVYTAPFPVYARAGSGATITLEDGTLVDDFLLNYTASALGHGHRGLGRAITAAVEVGGPYGLPTASEVELGEEVCRRFPSIERVRFTNSGSEATLQALRCARAHTGRARIAKAEGGYHGSHDLVDVSVTRFGQTLGEPVAETRGMSPEVASSVVVFPYNDSEGAVASLAPVADELACVIVEPFLNSGGVIPADATFLKAIETWCREHDVLFVLDEVASWRTSPRGQAPAYGLTPDLVCLGKALGGGLPVGALGGRADVMAEFDPRRSDVVRHAGTFNAHPATMAAGLVVLAELDDAAIARMGAQGQAIADGIAQIGEERGLPLVATHCGGIGRMHIAHRPPRDARQAAGNPSAPRVSIYRELLARGVLIGPDGRFSLSTVTSDEQIDRLLTALDDAAAAVLGPSGLVPTAPDG